MLPAPEIINETGAMTSRLAQDFEVNIAIEPAERHPFKAQIASFSLGHLKLAQIRFSPHIARRAAHLPHTATHRYLINQLVSGELFVSQDGRQARIEAGDIYLINSAREFTLEATEIVTNSIYVDGRAFRAAYPEVDYHTAIAFRQEEGTTSMVGNMIADLFQRGNDFVRGARERCGEAFPHVMAIALAAQTQTDTSCPSQLSLFHKERIKSFVRDHLWDPELNCEMIANALRLSQRYIYDVFADEPLTLMRWIRQERLRRCQRELSSVTLRNRSISEIAYAWGFVDPAHFSRVFSAEFGKSPRAFRLSQAGAMQAA